VTCIGVHYVGRCCIPD